MADEKEIANPFVQPETSNPYERELEEARKENEELLARPEYACTVVNLLPYSLAEPKPMMLPSMYFIPAAKGEVPGLGYVKEGIHFIPNPLIDEGKPGSVIRQVTSPAEMARSICEDYCIAHIALGEDAKPGLFWVEGKLLYPGIQKHYPKELAKARQQQRNWFANLINMADTDWQKNRNMLAVSDLQRMAASKMGVDREWVKWIEPDSHMKCKFCQSTISVDSVICAICRQVVNQVKFKEMQGV